MALTLTTADAALKEDYQPAMREQINQKVMFLGLLEKNTEDIEGRRAVLSLHTGRNGGIGARRAGVALPTAGNQSYTEERVSLRYNYGRIQVDGPTIRAMRSNKGSFVRAVDSETKGVVNDLRRDVNRQVFGTSDGKVATCGVTTASATVVLAAATTSVQMQQFHVGMKIDVGTLAQAVAGSGGRVHGATVSGVDEDAKTIVIGSAITTDGNDFVFIAGAAGSGSDQAELTGLQTIVDSTGTLFNVNPSTVPSWKSRETTVSGQLTDTVLEKEIHKVSIAGGADLNLFVTTDGVIRSYSTQLTPAKRFNDSQTLKGGYKAITIQAGGAEVALTWDRDCPAQTVFGVTTSKLVQFEASDWEFMEEDGAVLSRVSGYDAYEAVLFKYHELATTQRNAHSKLLSVTEA